MKSHRRISIVCLVFAIASGFAPEAFADEQAAKVSAEIASTNYDLRVNSDYCQKTLNKIDQIISKNFYSEQIAKNEWPKAKSELAKKINECKTIMELDAAVNAAIKKLHSSHCQYLTNNDETYYFLNALFSRFDRKLLPNRMDFTGVICGGVGLPSDQVRYIIDGSPGQQAKFQIGDRILTVSGEPYVGQANFFKTANKKIPVVVDRAGKRADLIIAPIYKEPYAAYVEACAKSARIDETTEGKIGYVHVWAGGQEQHDALESVLGGKLADTDGLILDMRDGYGGNPLSDLDFFYRDPAGYPLFTMTDRAGYKTGLKEFYNKPVVALINGGSRSGKELLAFSLKSSGRAKLVGEKTAGFVLGGRIFPIDDRSSLYLAVTDVQIGGKRLEGVGVEPDITVPNPKYTLDGVQEQLNKARETLLPQLKKTEPKPANTK